MLTILFWNIKGVARGGKMLSPSDARYINLSKWLAEEAADSHFGVPVDVMVLAESPFHGQLALPGMQPASTLLKPNSKTGCILEVYYRSSQVGLDLAGGVGRATVQKLDVLSTGFTMLLVAAHLQSPQRLEQEEDRRDAVRDLVEEIAFAEQQQKHKRTLLVGDLNYSPYDLPIYGAKYLHAVRLVNWLCSIIELSKAVNTGSFIIQCGRALQTVTLRREPTTNVPQMQIVVSGTCRIKSCCGLTC